MLPHPLSNLHFFKCNSYRVCHKHARCAHESFYIYLNITQHNKKLQETEKYSYDLVSFQTEASFRKTSFQFMIYYNVQYSNVDSFGTFTCTVPNNLSKGKTRFIRKFQPSISFREIEGSDLAPCN